MKKTMKLLVAFLCFVFMFTVVPSNIFAEENQVEPSTLETSEAAENTEAQPAAAEENTAAPTAAEESAEAQPTAAENGSEEANAVAPAAAPVALAANNALALQLFHTEQGIILIRNYDDATKPIGLPNGLDNPLVGTTNLFLGWTPVENYSGKPEEKIYSHTDSVKKVIDDGNGDSVLYSVFTTINEAAGELLLNGLSGKIEINKDKTAAETVPNADIKSNSGFEAGSTKKTVVLNYDPAKEKYEVVLDTNFNFSNNKVAGIVAANPRNVLKTAEGVNDFTGEAPKGYTYVDLHVKLDDKVDVAEVMNNVSFTSGLFMANAVLDTKYNLLSNIASRPADGETTVTFNFNNPNKLKEFIVRTTLRKNTTDPYSDMVLRSGDSSNITISKEYANEINNTNRELVFTGYIDGGVAVNKGALGPYAAIAPENVPIEKVDSVNTVNVKFGEAPKPVMVPAQVEVKWTCADEGKEWNEEKQMCVAPMVSTRKYRVPNTSSEAGMLGYTLASLVSLAGLVTLRNKRK